MLPLLYRFYSMLNKAYCFQLLTTLIMLSSTNVMIERTMFMMLPSIYYQSSWFDSIWWQKPGYCWTIRSLGLKVSPNGGNCHKHVTYVLHVYFLCSSSIWQADMAFYFRSLSLCLCVWGCRWLGRHAYLFYWWDVYFKHFWQNCAGGLPCLWV